MKCRYRPLDCALRHKCVWAILTQQAGSASWRIVNCLDKDEACFSLQCAFTAADGIWPFPVPAEEDASRPD